MKFYLLIFLTCWLFFNSSAQENSFAQRAEVEGSFYYFREFDINQIAFYEELSISAAFNLNLNNHFYIGLRSYIVRGRGLISPRFSGWHTLVGPTVKYHILKEKRIELNAEVGYFYGNYCPNCTPEHEFYRASLHYLGAALELNFLVVKAAPNWWLKTSFAFNHPVNELKLTGYNLGLVGVQYKFGKPTISNFY